MKKHALIMVAILFAASPGHAQIVVHDTSVTVRNAVTATLWEYLLETQVAQHSQLRRWAQRLSMFTDLGKYGVPDAPRWRTHPGYAGEGDEVAAAFQSALDFGDSEGLGYRSVTEQIAGFGELAAGLPLVARRVLEHQLSTIDAADAVSVATIHNSGRLRYAGRAELRAIEALEQDVTNGTLEQSATAVLDKISGASLIAARQRQARTNLMIGLVEQLMVDTKRERDSHAAAMNMQLSEWRYREATASARPSDAGTALQTWRQP